MSEGSVDGDALARHAYRILEQAEKKNVPLRIVGALAFHIRCPRYNYIQQRTGRSFKDIDFAGYFSRLKDTESVFRELGFTEDRELKTVPGIRRSIFRHPDHEWEVDVFYDVLEFCHDIDLKDRLEIDRITIPLADLLLQKLQIVQLNEKDVVDTLMLLREHELDGKEINVDYVAQLCKRDWGLWRTVTRNLEKLLVLVDDYDILSDGDREVIRDRIDALELRIENEPATMRWRLRNRIGERVKWYRDVDEVM